jgi:hypothetical protein
MGGASLLVDIVYSMDWAPVEVWEKEKGVCSYVV